MAIVPDQQYAFPSPSVPIVFNSSLLASQSNIDQSVDVNQTKTDHTSVQSRGTSPMLPASDSCAEDTEENKSDDNADEFVNVCDTEDKTDNTEEDIGVKQETKKCHSLEICDEDSEVVIDIVKNDVEIKKDDSVQPVIKDISKCELRESAKDLHIVSKEVQKTEVESSCVESRKIPKSGRNIFTDLTEYNPFMDPQVLQAADGLELLSALAEKSAVRLDENKASSESKEDIPKCKEPCITIDDVKLEKEVKVEKEAKNEVDVEKELVIPDEGLKRSDSTSDSNKIRQKSRVKCGYAFKPKKEQKNKKSDITKKLTTFCGISIPEGESLSLDILKAFDFSLM